MSSPTSRSLEHLRKQGWTCCVVEKTMRVPGKPPWKVDVYGFGDVLACKTMSPMVLQSPGGVYHSLPGIALVQTTSGSNLAARITKILAEPRAKTWLQAGGRILVHGWRQMGKKGKRKLWKVDEREISLQDFPVPESELAGAETVPS